MRTGHLSIAARLFVLLLPCGVLLFANLAAAEGAEGRPWGRLEKPSVSSTPDSLHQNGYMGRYNPWAAKAGEGGTGDTPRYRNREDGDPSSRAPQTVPYRSVPSGQYAPSYPPYQGPNSVGNGYYPYSPAPNTPYPGLFPGSGGLNPYYGGYWNDPYGSLQPDTGILWSDMWRR